MTRTLSRFAARAALALAVLMPVGADAGQFDGIEVRVATFGGRWRDIVAEHVAKPFEAEGGRIAFVLGQPANNVAKLIASRGQEPPFDLIEVLDNLMPAIIDGGFAAPLVAAAIPNVALLDPADHDATKVMIWVTQEGIVYNRKAFADAGIPVPTKYADLADPRLKGKISLPDISAGGAMPAIVGMAREAGGDEANIDAGLALVKKIAPASFWSSSSNLQTQLVNGDVWAAAAQAGNVQRLSDKAPLAMAFPPVGGKFGVLKQGYLVKVAGGRHSAAVDWIINKFLDQPMQVATFTEGGQVPVTSTALTAVRKLGSFDFLRLEPAEIAQMYRIDYSKVDQRAYVQKWNRQVAQ